jgi:hypothetical protein
MRGVEAQLATDRARLEELKASNTGNKQGESPADIFDLANRLARGMKSRGLACERSNVAGVGKKSVLQFNVSGDLAGLIAILQEASQMQGFSVLSVKLNAGQEGAGPQMVFRMGYEKK